MILKKEGGNTTRDVYINDAHLSSLKTPKSSHILFYDDMVFVIECASYFTYRDETSIFVVDVHLFYDKMAVVIEVYSFYDDLFLSLI